MAASDPTTTIQNIIDAAVTDHMGMSVYVVTDFDGSGPTAKFFCPSQIEVWDSNHNVVSSADQETLLFKIGSISKVFTSRIFYSLQGTYSGNTIGSCMPSISLPASIAAISVADIVSYASGFPQDNGLPPDPRGVFCPLSSQQTFSALASWFNNDPHSGWICPAGQCYTYSNMAWSLLAIAGLAPANTSVDVYSAYDAQLAKLAGTLGMTATALYADSQVPSMACGYTGTQAYTVGESYAPPAVMKFGSGSIVSSASDMLQWLLYNMGRGQTSTADFAILQTQQQQPGTTRNICGVTGACGSGQSGGPTTGVGWFFRTVAGASGSVVSKDGGVPGFTSWMGFESWVAGGANSPSGNGVVVVSAGQNASTVGPKIMAAILNADLEAAAPVGFDA